jgi:hypothetical protein
MQQGVVLPLFATPALKHTVCRRNAARCCFVSFCNPCFNQLCIVEMQQGAVLPLFATPALKHVRSS